MTIKTLFCLIISIPILLLGTTTLAATHQDFSISDAEKVIFYKNTLSDSNTDTKHLSFKSFQKNFNLVLKERRQLMNGFSPKSKNIKLYSGKIQDNDNSWARITVINNEYTGAIFDGVELYMIDIGDNINTALTGSSDMQGANTVIYKSSDLSTDLTCAEHGDHDDHDHGSAFSYKNLLSDSTRQQFSSNSTDINSGIEVAAATAFQQVNLRIVTDPDYNASSNLSPQEQVISQMNIVDGIFSEQVGVQFGITEIEVLNNNGPLTSTSPSELLGQFRDFVGNNNPGLAHFFTGRNLDGNVIGIAGLRAICRASGAGLTQAGGRGTFGALTAAHEFGHNFGAPHDNQGGSACAATAGTFLMNPSLNGSDEFSQCSLEQIANTLSTARCLVPVNITPIEPIQPAQSCDLSVDFANGTNDFEFINDSQDPDYSSPLIIPGSINILIGGVDDSTVTNIEGAWSRECISDIDRTINFNIQASLEQSSEYEANEFSQIAVRVNGTTTVLDTISGDGNGGNSITTGTRQFNTNVELNAGINTIELLCFNNIKTFGNESTQCRFNSLTTSETSGSGELCFPIENQNSEITMICL